mmetsp:Transcript_21928/g.45909  ORF Transcript_21928/g.45909 Transcript_21928/m.45909 type:complete len:645 (-) Transcript_21928:407-2341(-)|eukprot:CAMPEP_0196131566 /NCGR_PEP_ID=MMETSP0910-20130528/1515_1 /TAXON_ID=49265 /ORGANISM="Thalassiosira rotula, Strain GSO102" /LENGTH=644 /DNA_ID=CAMNT_0041391045 /DNA_START=49 /DNA_END=1983 /DNA_ORIENTATION=-
MTMKMDALQPEEIIVNQKEASHEMEEKDGVSKVESGGPDSPDGVDGVSPMDAQESESDDSDDSGDSDESGSGSEEDEEEEEEAMPDGDTNDDLHALLQFSKSRLEKKPQPPPVAEPTPTPTQDDDDSDDESDVEDDASDNENSEEIADAGEAVEGDMNSNAKPPVDESPAINKAHSDEKKMDTDAVSPPENKDQSYYIELAMKKAKVHKLMEKKEEDEESNLLKLAEEKMKEAELKAKQDDDAYLLSLAEKKMKEAELKAKQDDDPVYLRKVAEEKVKNALAKSKEEEEATSDNVARPGMPVKPARDENAELWALLNYSKRRLETGSTPQVKKRGPMVKGDDVSVSSKLSKSSKRSAHSKNSAKKSAPAAIAVVGGPGDSVMSPMASGGGTDANGGDATDVDGEGAGKTDAPFQDVTDTGDDSVDGSVSLESGTKNSDESDNSDDEDSDESSDEEEEEEEDDLPDFLKDSGEDPEEAKMMYEAAKFKAASILSVSEEKLTDVQMLQAIAIAEEAARKGDEKFSTKRSLFKLNEAKIEDLKSFLNLSISPKVSQQRASPKNEEVRWGIGKGRFIKKIGSVIQDFKEKCEEIDNKKEIERKGKPSNVEMLQIGMQDLKSQIEEYERIVTATKKQGKEAVSRTLSKS